MSDAVHLRQLTYHERQALVDALDAYTDVDDPETAEDPLTIAASGLLDLARRPDPFGMFFVVDTGGDDE